jgi:hypothetical protein
MNRKSFAQSPARWLLELLREFSRKMRNRALNPRRAAPGEFCLE